MPLSAHYQHRRPSLSLAQTVALRRARATPRPEQPVLFELQRPPGERCAAERHREPSLFTLFDQPE